MNHLAQIETFLQKSVSSYSHITTGRDYDVYIVDSLIFRFPKPDRSHINIHKEKKLVDIIVNHVSLPIPSYTIVDDAFIVYPLLPGIPVPNDPAVYNETMIDQLAEFLKQLHSIPLELVAALNPGPHHSEPDTVFAERMKQTVEERLSVHVSKATLQNMFTYIDTLFCEFTSSNQVLVHTDLQGKNILYDPHQKRITGIIDFTNTHRGSAAFDFCHFYDLSPEFLRQIIERYRGFRDQAFFDTVFFLARRTVLFEIMNEKVFSQNKEELLKKLRRYGF